MSYKELTTVTPGTVIEISDPAQLSLQLTGENVGKIYKYTGTDCVYKNSDYYVCKQLLPVGYTKLDYIESSGTQYIDTLTDLSNGCKIEADIYAQFNQTTNIAYFWAENSASPYGTIGARVNQKALQIGSGTGATAVKKLFDGDGRHRISISTNLSAGNFVSVDGECLISGSTITNITANSLCLFAANRGTVIDRYSTGTKIYSFKIFGSDFTTLVRDFIPCKNPSNVVGMYDTVSQTFFGNSGTGEFIAGEISLPSEYQRLEYIESTGEQYIDTGVCPTNNHSISTQIQITQNASTTYPHIYYVKDSDSNINRFGVLSADMNWRCDYYSTMTRTSYVVDTTKHMLTQLGNIFYLDGTQIASMTEVSFTSSMSLYLFGANYVGSASYMSSMRMWSCQIWSDKAQSTLTRNFIPCIRKSDATVGMYDLVNNQFYFSGTSTGFLPGPVA